MNQARLKFDKSVGKEKEEGEIELEDVQLAINEKSEQS